MTDLPLKSPDRQPGSERTPSRELKSAMKWRTYVDDKTGQHFGLGEARGQMILRHWDQSLGKVEDLGVETCFTAEVAEKEAGTGRPLTMRYADFRAGVPVQLSPAERRHLFTNEGHRKMPIKEEERKAALEEIKKAAISEGKGALKTKDIMARLQASENLVDAQKILDDIENLPTEVPESQQNGQSRSSSDEHRSDTRVPSDGDAHEGVVDLGDMDQSMVEEFLHVDPRLREAFVASMSMGKLEDWQLFGFAHNQRASMLDINRRRLLSALDRKDMTDFNRISDWNEKKRVGFEFEVAKKINEDYIGVRYNRLARYLRENNLPLDQAVGVQPNIAGYAEPLAIASYRLARMSDSDLFGYKPGVVPTCDEIYENASYLLNKLADVPAEEYANLSYDQIEEMKYALQETTGKYIGSRFKRLTHSIDPRWRIPVGDHGFASK